MSLSLHVLGASFQAKQQMITECSFEKNNTHIGYYEKGIKTSYALLNIFRDVSL